MPKLRNNPFNHGTYTQATVSPLIVGLTCAGLACFALFSGMFLDAYGWPYTLSGSPLPLKIHPGSYFILTAFLLVLVSENPMIFLYRLAAALPAHFIYLITVIGLIVYTLLRFGTSGASFMIDLHLMPVIVGIVLSRFSTALLARIFTATIIYLAVNAGIGIVEYLTQTRVTPYLVDGKPELEEYFRATALLGHPLQNALITAMAMLALPTLRDRKLLGIICMPVLGFGMIAFGGRSALAVVVAIAFVVLPLWAIRHLLRRDYSYQQLVGSVMAGIFIAGVTMAVLVSYGGDTRVLAGLHWDASANTRLIGLRALDLVSSSEIMFGIGQQGILDRTQMLASYYGIIGLENSWLLLVLTFGAVGLLFFATALLAWFREMLIRAPVPAYLIAFGFLMIASTNNTLAAKDSSLIEFVVLVYGARAYALMLNRPARSSRRAGTQRSMA